MTTDVNSSMGGSSCPRSWARAGRFAPSSVEPARLRAAPSEPPDHDCIDQACSAEDGPFSRRRPGLVRRRGAGARVASADLEVATEGFADDLGGSRLVLFGSSVKCAAELRVEPDGE